MASRTELSLTRLVDLAHAGEIANLEFDLPPPGPNAAPHLILGLRIARPDAESVLAFSDSLHRAQLQARVRLLRLKDATLSAVPLMRSSPNLREWLAVPQEGTIHGVTGAGVDTSSLIDAGLIQAGSFDEVLMFAVAEDVVPGRYQLTIALLGENPTLDAGGAELLVAYQKRGK